MSRCVTLSNFGPKTVTIGNVRRKTATGQNHDLNCILCINNVKVKNLDYCNYNIKTNLIPIMIDTFKKQLKPFKFF
jgi:hypothetical protein